MNHTPPPIVPAVISQHVDEAPFCWSARDDAVGAPHYSLKDLAELDDRLEAHIDGLRIAGEPGWEICSEQLDWEEAGEVFTGGVLAFESRNPERIQEVLKAGMQSVEVARGLISALGWLSWEQSQVHIGSLLASEEPLERRTGIAAAAIHRRDCGQALEAAVAAAEAEVRSRALRAAGELGQTDLLVHCRDGLKADEPDSRFWAAWSAALLGDVRSSDVLRELAESGGPFAERACDLAARRMDQPNALTWQRQLAGQERNRRLAIKAAGAMGDPVLVPWLIDIMKVDELARPAGEAFSNITGIDLSDETLEGEWPEGFEAGPTENPEDEDVEMDPDEDLPWPEPQLIDNWWSENGGRFSSGTRYLCGRPIVSETLGEVLKTGSQRQRAAAALEIVLRQPGQPLFEVRARGGRQMRALGLLTRPLQVPDAAVFSNSSNFRRSNAIIQESDSTS